MPNSIIFIRTVKLWDCRQPTAAATVTLDERVYAMDAASPALVVGTASNQIHVFDLTAGLSKKVIHDGFVLINVVFKFFYPLCRCKSFRSVNLHRQ